MVHHGGQGLVVQLLSVMIGVRATAVRKQKLLEYDQKNNIQETSAVFAGVQIAKAMGSVRLASRS